MSVVGDCLPWLVAMVMTRHYGRESWRRRILEPNSTMVTTLLAGADLTPAFRTLESVEVPTYFRQVSRQR
jgi:hypothetical protein